jgi:hypothetical protein
MKFDQVIESLLDLADQYPRQTKEKIMQKIESDKNNKMAGHGLRPLVNQPSISTVDDTTAADTTGNTMIALTTATKKAKTTGAFTLNGQQS